KKIISLDNQGAGVLPDADEPIIQYADGEGWLSVSREGRGNEQRMVIAADATGMAPGVYSARVQVNCPGALNELQSLRVQLTIPTYPPAHRETRDLVQEVIDNSDKRFNR